ERGEKNGRWTEWYLSGHIKEQGGYRMGVQHGRWVYYDDRGIISREQTFKDGRPEGYWAEYYANGKKKSEGSYLENFKHGKWSYWDQDGKLLYGIVFDKGKKIKEVKP
ncbi:MAG TPA: hypothetical protein PLE85_09600, partial [Bacteroidales bacterium]|nr:hypothetical protein [Bacteroidales bacterium]